MFKPAIQILIIEDSQMDVLLLEEALSRDAFYSFELTSSERLSSAFDILQQKKFDLILLDLGLPDSQGLETFEKLHRECPEIPVVVLSGLINERLALEAVQAGAQDYLVKGPASWEIAPRAIRYAIERQRADETLRASETKYRKLFDEMSNGCALHQIICDDSGNPMDYVTVDTNAAFESLLGVRREQIIGKKASEMLPPGELKAWVAIFGHTALTGTSTHYEMYSSLNERYFAGVAYSPEPGKFAVTFSDVTERKLAEEKLNQSENRYRLATKATNDVIWEWNAKTHQLILTENAQAVLGYSPEEIGPDEKWWDEHVHPENREYVLGKLNALLAGDGSIWSEEYRFLLKDGSYAHISDHGYVERDANGEPLRMIGAMSDITKHKQAEQALKESEERFRGLYNNATIGLYRTTPDGRILLSNPAAVRLLGFDSFEELANRNLEEDGFEPNYPRREFHERMERDGVVIGLECEWVKKDDTPIVVRESARAVRDNQGKILYYDGTFEDITLHKLAEKALRESEEKYRLLFENAPVGVYQSTPDGRYVSVNPAMASIYLYDSPEEMMAQITDIARQIHVDPTQRERFKSLLTDKGEVREFINQNYRCDGSTIWTSTNARAVKDAAGNILYYEGFMSDITSRKQAEEAIRQSEKKFKTLFEIAPVGISVLDREYNIVDTNYALQRITGLRKNELVNGAYHRRTYLRPDGSLMTPDEYASTRALKENMPIFDIETGIVTDDRGVVWTQVSAAPLDMPDASLVVITQDISERKQSEQTLRQRLAELETLYESGLSFNQFLEPQEIGQKIIDVLAEKLDWYHTTIRLYHPESNSLELLAYNLARQTTKKEWQLMGDRFRTMIARPGNGLSGWALQHGETVRCNEVLHDPRYIETVPGIRSGLYVPIKTGERAIGVISVESEKPDYFTAEDEHLAVTLAAQAAVALDNIRLFKDLQKSNNDLFRAYDETIEGWSHALDLRDKETEGHTRRVTRLTEELAREIGVSTPGMVHIRRGALLHDIGKMGVPDRILLKPDKLTEEEWIIMREHPVHAYNLLSRIEFLRPALNIPHYHHERWDGSGYPDGLRGEQIPLEARIFAVIDVFDALTSDRPYRPAWPEDKALRYMRKVSSSHFDPQVVEAFMKLISAR